MLNKIRQLLNDDLILVYQMGKVASTGLVNTIREHGLNCRVVYGFYRHPVDSIFKNYKSSVFYRPFLQRLKYRIKFSLLRMIIMRRKKVKILSLVREPIARNMSFFFQDIQIPIMDLHIDKNTVESDEISSDELIISFFTKFNHLQGISWFDDEFKKSTGIDIYKHDFNKKEGFARFSCDGADIMVARMENLDTLANELSDFLGIPDFVVSETNTGSRKWYSEVYREFKDKIQFNEEYIDGLYKSRFMEYFYSEKEILNFKKHYLKKV
ncbi:MAG: hypothetical protein JXB24_01030 [Bacteroidales bacterium]|nr:hypothetical protein [Bacteroidales bacterium]